MVSSLWMIRSSLLNNDLRAPVATVVRRAAAGANAGEAFERLGE